MVSRGTKWEVTAMLFIGTFYQKVDEKNRIVLPSKFRTKLGENAIITLGYDKCLSVYTEGEWDKLQTKLLEYSDTKSDYRRHVRAIASSATECSFDSHGRVTLPATLLKTIGIEKEIVLIGNLNHIEIWSKEAWDKYYEESVNSFDELSERMNND